MFTGLIYQQACLEQVIIENNCHQWSVNACSPADDPWQLGESIALNGVCTTVTQVLPNHQGFTVLLSPETLAVTALKTYGPGNTLNLERALKANDRLGGHWVTGHVEAVGQVVDILPDGDCYRLWIRVNNPEQAPLLLPKGSITVDGVSLTVNEVTPLLVGSEPRGVQFGVAIIPHTWQHTLIHTYQADTPVNLEFDLIGKYVQQWVTPLLQTSPSAAAPTASQNTPIPEAFFPAQLGNSHIHTGRWFNLDRS